MEDLRRLSDYRATNTRNQYHSIAAWNHAITWEAMGETNRHQQHLQLRLHGRLRLHREQWLRLPGRPNEESRDEKHEIFLKESSCSQELSEVGACTTTTKDTQIDETTYKKNKIKTGKNNKQSISWQELQWAQHQNTWRLIGNSQLHRNIQHRKRIYQWIIQVRVTSERTADLVT